MKQFHTTVAAVFLLATLQAIGAQSECSVEDSGTVGDVKVRLIEPAGKIKKARFGFFKASLAVNTDGAPTSYHPQDYVGSRFAINHMDNAIVIRKLNGLKPTLNKRIEIFNKWRDSDWKIPKGYSITWKNVIAATKDGKPCVFQQDQNRGYLGSLTALKNGLSGVAAGECEADNQLDQRVIPAIVLRGTSNPLKRWGARTGDLVLVVNPQSNTTAFAVIGDTGDGDRVGEGSVALNMALLGITAQPTNYSETKSLDTGNKKMLVSVIPGSFGFKRERPYTAANIAQRVETWAKEQYGSMDDFKATVVGCSALP